MPAFAPDFNPNACVIRRVRLDLPSELPPPYKAMLEKLPYDAWLKTHAAEVLALKNDKGECLLSKIHPRMGQKGDNSVFVTDFCFPSPAAMDYYNQHYLAIMRGRIEESYPGATAQGSPFSYRIALDSDAETFAALLDGVTNMQTII